MSCELSWLVSRAAAWGATALRVDWGRGFIRSGRRPVNVAPERGFSLDVDVSRLDHIGPPAAIDLGHYCTVHRESPGTTGVEDRVLIGEVLSAPTKLGRQLSKDK